MFHRSTSIARRPILKAILVTLISPVLHLLPGVAGASRPLSAFSADSVNSTLRELFGTADIPESDRVQIGIANLAEDGAVVPVKIETGLTGVQSISIIASKNPVPLVAGFELGSSTKGFIATRIKLAETSEVLAVVKTADGLFLARETVQVTIGGCAN